MLKKITHNKITWTNISKPTEDEIRALKKKHTFHELDIEDLRSNIQRPKAEVRSRYRFLILRFPVFSRETFQLKMVELDIFWGKNYLITVHHEKLPRLSGLFKSAVKKSNVRRSLFEKDVNYLVYKIIDLLTISFFPIMDRIGYFIDDLDRNFNRMKGIRSIEKISILRRNIIFTQTALRPMKRIFGEFEENLQDDRKPQGEMAAYWGALTDDIDKLIDSAEDYQELIEGLYNSIDTLMTFRLNNTIKVLTQFSVIMLPLTFITGFYGMNINLPLQDTSSFLAFFIVSLIMGGVIGAMLLYFKIKNF